uniref:Uncharacterized protein n=1 Tax=Anguilla anguilla TaxID=7936 RepID=A0A0E9TKG6_ANGAN
MLVEQKLNHFTISECFIYRVPATCLADGRSRLFALRSRCN